MHSSLNRHLDRIYPNFCSAVPQMGVTAEAFLDGQAKVKGEAGGLLDRVEEPEGSNRDSSEAADGAMFQGGCASFARAESTAPAESSVPGTIALASMIVHDLDIAEGGYPAMRSVRGNEAADSEY